jgi:hypothetical protein
MANQVPKQKICHLIELVLHERIRLHGNGSSVSADVGMWRALAHLLVIVQCQRIRPKIKTQVRGTPERYELEVMYLLGRRENVLFVGSPFWENGQYKRSWLLELVRGSSNHLINPNRPGVIVTSLVAFIYQYQNLWRFQVRYQSLLNQRFSL